MKNANNEKNIDKLKQAGLKVTHSRCKILEIFQSFPDEHYTADKLKDLLDDQGENIGLSYDLSRIDSVRNGRVNSKK